MFSLALVGHFILNASFFPILNLIYVGGDKRLLSLKMPYHGDPPPLQQFGLMCSSINLAILESALGYRLQLELQITW